jgi:hypothetical protein
MVQKNIVRHKTVISKSSSCDYRVYKCIIFYCNILFYLTRVFVVLLLTIPVVHSSRHSAIFYRCLLVFFFHAHVTPAVTFAFSVGTKYFAAIFTVELLHATTRSSLAIETIHNAGCATINAHTEMFCEAIRISALFTRFVRRRRF